MEKVSHAQNPLPIYMNVCAFSASLSSSNIKSLCAYNIMWLNHRASPRETAVLLTMVAQGEPPASTAQSRPPTLPPKEHRQPMGQK